MAAISTFPSRLFEREKALLKHLSIVEGRKHMGLFGLGAGYLFFTREIALLRFAREHRISLNKEGWRQLAIERVAFDRIDEQSRRRERGRPRTKVRGLLGSATLPQPDQLLVNIEYIKAEALKRGNGTWSDSSCVDFYVTHTEFEGIRPTSGNRLRVYEAHSRTLKNKLSKLRTSRKGTRTTIPR